jgi:hypothetical protein
MSEPRQPSPTAPGRDRPGVNDSSSRTDYVAGANGDQDVDASDAADPQPDHSEREWGGDQDIDTAGQIPGEMVTDPDSSAKQ